MLLFWILMIVFVGIAVIVGVVKFKETKSMAADGKIINRKSMFWEDAELFTTTATYEQLKSAVKDGDFSSSSVDIYYDADGQKAILFKSNHAWNECLIHFVFSYVYLDNSRICICLRLLKDVMLSL